MIASINQTFLSRDPRFSLAAVFHSGQEALEWLRKRPVELLILDVYMPRMSGLELLRELRRRGIGIDAVMVTAANDGATVDTLLKMGVVDYLVKPFDFDELLARIRAMTRKHAGQRTNRFTAGDLVLDVEARRVTRGGEEIPLLPKEFSILEYLMRNKEKVVSREQIEDRIWNYEFTGSSNNVDGYMSRLRKKIDEGRPHRLIHTLRGVGWVLREPPEDGEGTP